MPTCPHCGDEFPAGGAFTSHTRNCDLAPDEGENGSIDSEVLQARVASLEREINSSVPRKHEIEALKERVTELEREVARLDRHQELIEELFDFADGVADRGDFVVSWEAHPEEDDPPEWEKRLESQ
jgi:hypothetical protein